MNSFVLLTGQRTKRTEGMAITEARATVLTGLASVLRDCRASVLREARHTGGAQTYAMRVGPPYRGGNFPHGFAHRSGRRSEVDSAALVQGERTIQFARALGSGIGIGVGICTSALNQAQIDEIDPSDGPCGSGGRYQPTGHMSGVYTPSGGR